MSAMADSLAEDASSELAESDSDCFDETEGEALLLSVFEACNANANGEVKVSRLINHLFKEAAADENPKILGYLDELAIVLDPSGTDILIDKAMYNQGIRTWIERVQAQRSFQDSDGKLIEDHVDDPAFIYKGRGQGDPDLLSFVNGYGEKSLDDHSFCTSGSTNEWEKSQSEILGRIEELQIANKKLIDEKEKLRAQVDNTEEINSLLHNDIRTMKNKFSKHSEGSRNPVVVEDKAIDIEKMESILESWCTYEQLLEKTKSIEKEYESLKSTVNDYRTTKEELLTRTSQLEKENAALQLMIDDYQISNLSKNAALEEVREENRELLEKLNEQKKLYSDLEVLQDLKQKMVDESSSKSEYMASFIAELSMANEALKAEKSRLEVDLLESKHEISKLATMNTPSSIANRQPICASTPFQRSAPVTLQQELDAEMVVGDSPASSREHSAKLIAVTSEKSNDDTNESAHSDASASTAASTDKYTSAAQKIALNFKRKKELALKQIAELAAFDSNSDTIQKSQVIIKNYEEGLDKFANEFEGLAAAKRIAETRSNELMKSLELAKAENKRLAEGQERALLKLGDISLTREGMEQRINELVGEINEEKRRVENLISENESLKEKLNLEETMNSKVLLENEDLKRNDARLKEKMKSKEESKTLSENDQQIDDLIKLVADLEERNHKYTRKLFEFEDNLSSRDDMIARKDEEIARLKSECLEISNQHESDMKEIMKLFSMSDDSFQETQGIPTLELLKKKFAIFVESLKQPLPNMGVRDGPIGSECNRGTVEEAPPIASSRTSYPGESSTTEVKLQRCWEVMSLSTKCCQTDIQMEELGNAFHAYTMLKALQQGDNEADSCGRNGSEAYRTSVEEEIGNVCIDISRSERERHNDSQDDNKNREYGLTETDENYALSGHTSNTIPELKEATDYCNDIVLEDVNYASQLIPARPEELTDNGCTRGTSDGSRKAKANKMYDASSDDLPREDKRTNRKFRSDSVSTDESNSSDENGDDIIEELSNRPKSSPKIELSTVNSAVSGSSIASSKRGRRIGISAEPVRLPTWTELRESIKLNQQIFIEEEVTHQKILLRTPRNSVDETTVKLHDINYNHSLSLENIDILKVSDGSNVADTSMEWCYEFSTNQTAKGISHVMRQQSRGGIVKEESRDSATGSIHSLEESIQAPTSTGSSMAAGAATNSQKGSEEEEKVSEVNSEVKAKPEELGRKHLIEKNEEHPAIDTSYVDKDLEKRFNTILLSFKTDQYTLQKRLENQTSESSIIAQENLYSFWMEFIYKHDCQNLAMTLLLNVKEERARDVAESGMEREIRKLAEKLQTARKLSFTRELKEMLGGLVSHTDVLRKAGMKVSAQAEQHGCFQQEWKLAPVIETVITYAERLRLALARSKEIEEVKTREVKINVLPSSKNGVDKSIQHHGYCKKCNGLLSSQSGFEVKENGFLGQEQKQEKKSNPLTFFGLTSTILHEKRYVSQREMKDEEKCSSQDSETFKGKRDTLNYSSNDAVEEEDEEEEESVSEFEKPNSSLCNCIFTVFRFFVSVVMLSTILFLFANYVELDLTMMLKNWNEQLLMYFKKFSSRDKENL